MPKLCVTRTINLSNTQFRYELVFLYTYIVIYGCLWHLLPRQNLPSASFAQAKHAQQYVLPGCMICLIQRQCQILYNRSFPFKVPPKYFKEKRDQSHMTADPSRLTEKFKILKATAIKVGARYI